MTWVGLRHKGFEILYPEEWNAVVDALDILYMYWSGTLHMWDLSNVENDVAPAEDNKYDVGKPDRRWREVYAMYGYFYEQLLVQGKPVIKDGDPIQIANFIDQARVDIDDIKQELGTIASNTGTTASNTGDIKTQLGTISSKLDTISGKIDTVNNILGSISNKLDTSNARLSDVVVALSEIDAKVSVIEVYAGYIPDIYARLIDIGAKIDTANARLVDIDTKLGSIETKTGSIDTKLSDVITSLSDIDTKLGSVKDYTGYLPDIYARVSEVSTKLDTSNDRLGSIDAKAGSIDTKLSDVVVTLSEIDTKLGSVRDYARYLPDIYVKIGSIEVKVASIDTKLDTANTRLSSIDTKVGSIDSKLDTNLSTRASEETLKKCCAIDYDFSIRRNAGRLLATVDFTINQSEFGLVESDLGLIRVEGDVATYSVALISNEGIPQPEGTGSPYVLKVVVKAGGQAYIRVPIKARFLVPFTAYIALYSKDYDVYVLPFVTLGGYLTSYRNKLPKRLRLPANNWGRFMVHWFMEAHHGCAEVDIEIYNPQTVDVVVYIGLVSACELSQDIKGYGLVFGWEGVFEMELNNETQTFSVDIMIPPSFGEVIHMSTSISIAGDGTNPLSATVRIRQGGVAIMSVSEVSTTPSTHIKSFKLFTARRGVYGYETVSLEFSLSTVGFGKVTSLQVVVYGFGKEYRYSKAVQGVVEPGSTVTVIDFSSDVKHVCGGEIEVVAPNDGSVELVADTSEGEVPIEVVPAGYTKRVKVDGRYLYVKIRNNSASTSASYAGRITVSDSYLLR